MAFQLINYMFGKGATARAPKNESAAHPKGAPEGRTRRGAPEGAHPKGAPEGAHPKGRTRRGAPEGAHPKGAHNTAVCRCYNMPFRWLERDIGGLRHLRTDLWDGHLSMSQGAARALFASGVALSKTSCFFASKRSDPGPQKSSSTLINIK